jgi:transcriptional regulator with XRE-family HTH domain
MRLRLCADGQGTVSQYLNGKIPLNVDASAKLARHLKCSIDDFSPTMAQELRSLGDGLAPDEQNIIMPEAAAQPIPPPAYTPSSSAPSPDRRLPATNRLCLTAIEWPESMTKSGSRKSALPLCSTTATAKEKRKKGIAALR